MPTRRHRARRRATARAIAVAISLLAFAAGLPGSAAAQGATAVSGSVAAGGALPPQGLYEGCAPGGQLGACTERLRRIRRAGFRYVLNYASWYGSAAEVRGYADAAAALGLQLIWPLNHPAWRGHGDLAATYRALAGGRTDAPDAELLASALSLTAGHPATWGFYIGDELAPAEAPRVSQLSAAVRRLAPAAPQLYVARPGAALLRPFARFADLAGIDTYPIGSGDPHVGRAVRTARAVASDAGAATAVVLQAFSWSQYRPAVSPPLYPSARAMRRMRDAAIRHADPAMILWYSYQDVIRADRPRRRWLALIHAAFSPGVGATHVSRSRRS